MAAFEIYENREPTGFIVFVHDTGFVEEYPVSKNGMQHIGPGKDGFVQEFYGSAPANSKLSLQEVVLANPTEAEVDAQLNRVIEGLARLSTAAA